MAAWNERLGKAQKQIIDIVTLLSAHFEGVAESLRGEEAQPRAAALYNGIRNQCHTVNDLAAIGVRRISVGGTLARVAMHAFAQSARQISQEGKFDSFAGVISNAELNKFFHDDLRHRPKP